MDLGPDHNSPHTCGTVSQPTPSTHFAAPSTSTSRHSQLGLVGLAPTSESSTGITLRGLIVARWVMLGILCAITAIQLLLARTLGHSVVWFDWFPGGSESPLFLATLAIWALINLATAQFVHRGGHATTALAGVHLLIDAAALTVLLAVSGGATNPFTTLYFVPITLATLVSPRWTWALAAFGFAGFAGLLLLPPPDMPMHGPPLEGMPETADTAHTPEPPDMPGMADTPDTADMPGMHAADPDPAGGPGPHFEGHLQGMWVAFGVTGVLVTYFVHRIAISLARQRRELEQLREAALRNRHLTAMGTLAAGAAHELGTPLGTLALLASEFRHMDEPERKAALETMGREIRRCKSILHRMDSPELRVEALGHGSVAPWRLADLEREMETDAAVAIRTRFSTDDARTTQPREVLGQVLRELVANATHACESRPGAEGIEVILQVVEDEILLVVQDDGVGMDPGTSAAARDPFFTTRPEGAGMGLGLYLAEAHVHQLGGTLAIDSAPDQGTTVTVTIPLYGPELTPAPGDAPAPKEAR